MRHKFILCFELFYNLGLSYQTFYQVSFFDMEHSVVTVFSLFSTLSSEHIIFVTKQLVDMKVGGHLLQLQSLAGEQMACVQQCCPDHLVETASYCDYFLAVSPPLLSQVQ